MPSRARERQLAKLAARRQAERQAARRRRNRIYGGIAVAAALVALIVAWQISFGGNDETTAASGTPSASATPSGKPGTQTGTVDPTPAPAQVACGGSVPKTASQPKPQFAGPPPMKIDPKATYTATFETSCGTIVVELDPKTAPQTVNSFVFLADKGFFDGQYVIRLDTSIDVIQAGDPTGTGGGGPGYTIPDELTGNESYAPGVLAMANGGPNTGGSQFFLITGPNGKNLDANPAYTIFGKVVEGLDVAQQIQQLPIQDASTGMAGQRPTDAIYFDSVTIEKS
jgi:cyclophilin family peptidyl-prolyl cis-trans isomerase